MKLFRTFDELPHPEKVKEYKKKTTIKAVRMAKDFAVQTLEGTMKGKAGDWLAKGVRGELYVIEAEIFDETYEEK